MWMTTTRKTFAQILKVSVVDIKLEYRKL